MAMVAAPHIKRDDRGVAWVDETNVKVIEIVLDRLAYGWSPEEVYFQHPELSLAQIYAALTYYYDNQVEFDGAIASQQAEVRRLREGADEPPLVARLRALGLLT